MNLTAKETNILNELKAQEQLCIEKYSKYEAAACDPNLKQVFSRIRSAEEEHLSTVCKLLSGEEVAMPSTVKCASEFKYDGSSSPCDESTKKNDAYLCKDALSMEKHVSGVYNTGVFEFNSTVVRDTLAHIQKEEQNHGELLYSYLAKSGMYN